MLAFQCINEKDVPYSSTVNKNLENVLVARLSDIHTVDY